MSVDEAASLLGVGRSTAYEAVKARLAGDGSAWPTPILRVGGRLRVPSVPLYAALGLSVEVIGT